MLRKTKFAGSFYPRFAEPLARDMNDWFSAIQTSYVGEHVLGVIVPHAGYMYSGACAAYGFHRLLDQKIESFIILHPSHRGEGFDFSLSPFTRYETPFGEIEYDPAIYEMIQMRENRKIDNWYHENEHSMEIQLPFIKKYFDGIPINAIMIGNQCEEVSHRLALQLSDIIAKANKRIAVVVSTDLSHYRPSDKAEKLDAQFCKYVRDIDPAALSQAIINGNCEACGFGGVLSLLHLAKLYRNPSCRILNYTHSGKVSGANDQVVGYLSAAISI